MTKVDAFCHVLPQPYYDRLQEISTERAANLLRRTAPIKSLYDMDERMRVIDEFEDYVQVISLAAPPIESLGDPALSAELARLGNDSMAELVQEHPDRFVGFVAGLPLNDVDASMEELERAIGDLGALGVQVYNHVNGLPFDDPRFEPLFARMAELEQPIWVHPARNSSWPDYPTEEKSKFELWWLFGWPYDTSAFMARLVFSGLMSRYPGLKIVTHHAGGMVPFFSGRVGPGMDSFGARTPDDESELVESGLEGRPLDAFKLFYADTAVFGAPHALRCAYEFFGIDHMLFASDMPFDPVQGTFIRNTISDVESLGLSDADREQIYEGNARGAPGSEAPGLDGVVPRAFLDRDPAQLGEFLDRGFSAEAPEAAGLDAAEGHLRLVVHGRAVHVADAALDAPRHVERGGHVPAEHRGRQAVLGVVGHAHGLVGAVDLDQPDDRPERLLAVDPHLRR